MKTKPVIFLAFLSLSTLIAHSQQKLNYTPLPAADTSLAPIEAAFNNKLNNVKLVGLGEATHGDKTTFAFNLKMLKYLVSERGFRTLIMEAPNSLCKTLDVFIKNDSACSVQQVDTLIYKTLSYGAGRELQFASIIKWLKDYNLSHKEQQISIRGMSVDVADRDSILKNDIKPYDPAGAAVIAQKWKTPGYKKVDEWNDVFTWQDAHAQLLAALPANDKKRIAADLDESKRSLELYMDLAVVRENKNELVVTDGKGKETALDNNNFFRKLRANPDYHRNDSLNRFTVLFNRRDSLMAVYTLKGAGDQLTIVWAHNAHVIKPGRRVMGDYLNRALGKQYFTIITDYSKTGSIIGFNPFYYTRKSPDAMAGHTMVKELTHKYNMGEGIVFSNELSSLGYTIAGIHQAGVDGVFMITSVPVKGFDALAVLGALQPRDFMK